MKALLFASLLLLGVSNVLASTEPAPDAATLLKRARITFDGLADYTCVLSSKELVDGKLKQQDGMRLMFRKPASYRMKWSNDWVEIFYVQGLNDNKMVVHGGMLLGYLRVKVPLSAALKYSRHTLVEADIGHTLDLVEKNYQRAAVDKDALIVPDGKETLNGQPTLRFRAVFPPDKGYYGHIVRVNLHEENGLPLKIEVHGWQNELLEQYEFSNLKLNTGLTAADFGGESTASTSNGKVDAR